MKAFIVSVHVPNKFGAKWNQIQSDFIAKTHDDYEYGVIVNGGDSRTYPHCIQHLPKQVSHFKAILVALNLYAQRSNEFDRFVLLDSDCWPVRPDWVSVAESLLVGYQYLAPMRVENLDKFPHPSAFYARRAFLQRADFGFRPHNNLLGTEVSDIGSAMPQIANEKQLWFPLLKSNYLSPHPVYASIYSDLFYHHCAGSRGIGFRGASLGYYTHTHSRSDHRRIYEEVTRKLLTSPSGFIDMLRGIGTR